VETKTVNHGIHKDKAIQETCQRVPQGVGQATKEDQAGDEKEKPIRL
jgi:hypothetical protein